MLPVFSRSVASVLILLGLSSIANAQSGATQQSTINPGSSGWTYVQDSISTAGGTCLGGSSACTVGPDNLLPTTAGSVLAVFIKTGNSGGDAISSVCTGSGCTGTGPGWTACPSCQIHNSTINSDAWYDLNAPGGVTSLTVRLASPASGFFQVEILELLPPPGNTALFDTFGTKSDAGCTSCSAVGLTTSATDAIFEFQAGGSVSGWSSWSSPYVTDAHGNGLYLNAPSGSISAPTLQMSGSTNVIFVALAFRSTLGSFTPPAQQFSLVHFTNFTGLNCSPTCGLTVPQTSTGNLVFIQAGDITNAHIQSVSGGGTWVVPSGCNITLSSTSDNVSCAYTLSATPTTSISVTMSGSGSIAFTVSEISTTSGTFSLDTSASAQRAATFDPQGPNLTLTGSNDVIFAAIFAPGGISAATLYPMPYINGFSLDFFNNEAAASMLLNTTNGTGPQWANGTNNPTAVAGIAFRVIGGSTPPNPPTGLAVAVQ